MQPQALDAAITDFAQALGLLVRRVRAAAGQELSWTETAVLKRLLNEGPATAANLARAEGMRPQSMGSTIAALEKMGLVRRTPHPTDGRQRNIEITELGARVRQRVWQAKHNWLAQAISQLDPEERQALFTAGQIIKRLAARCPAGQE